MSKKEPIMANIFDRIGGEPPQPDESQQEQGCCDQPELTPDDIHDWARSILDQQAEQAQDDLKADDEPSTTQDQAGS
jgi:hypothetical protein